MLKRAIIPLLVVGTSSAAFADRYDDDRRGERREREELRERRAREELRERRERERERLERERERRHRERWRPVVTTTHAREVSLVGATSLASRLEVDACGKLAGLSLLRLEPRGGGRTFVDRVVVTYSDRPAKVVEVDRYVAPGAPIVQVALGDADDVQRVVVEGRSEYGGAIAIDAI
jgi:hypothetical protein